MATQASYEAATQAETQAISDFSGKAVNSKTKKKLVRRVEKDRSAIYRRSFQGAFLLLNLWIGAQFYSWVRHFELGLGPSQVTRPAGVEGWLPIAGLMNLKYLTAPLWKTDADPGRGIPLRGYRNKTSREP